MWLLFVGDTKRQSLSKQSPFTARIEIQYLKINCQHFKTGAVSRVKKHFQQVQGLLRTWRSAFRESSTKAKLQWKYRRLWHPSMILKVTTGRAYSPKPQSKLPTKLLSQVFQLIYAILTEASFLDYLCQLQVHGSVNYIIHHTQTQTHGSHY